MIVSREMADASIRLDEFLDSYREDQDYRRRMFGPPVYPIKPGLFDRSRRRDERETNRRLAEHGLPKIDDELRWRFFNQPGQMREDAGGYLRRRWMVAFGFDHREYDAWRYQS